MTTLLSRIAFAAALATGVAIAPAARADAGAVIVEQRVLGAVKAIELAGPYHVVIAAQGRAAL